MKYIIDFDKSIHGFNSGWQGRVTITVNSVVIYSWYTNGTNNDEEFKIVQSISLLANWSNEDTDTFNKLRDKTIDRMIEFGWDKYQIHPSSSGCFPITAIMEYVIVDGDYMYFDNSKFLIQNYTR